MGLESGMSRRHIQRIVGRATTALAGAALLWEISPTLPANSQNQVDQQATPVPTHTVVVLPTETMFPSPTDTRVVPTLTRVPTITVYPTEPTVVRPTNTPQPVTVTPQRPTETPVPPTNTPERPSPTPTPTYEYEPMAKLEFETVRLNTVDDYEAHMRQEELRLGLDIYNLSSHEIRAERERLRAGKSGKTVDLLFSKAMELRIKQEGLERGLGTDSLEEWVKGSFMVFNQKLAESNSLQFSDVRIVIIDEDIESNSLLPHYEETAEYLSGVPQEQSKWRLPAELQHLYSQNQLPSRYAQPQAQVEAEYERVVASAGNLFDEGLPKWRPSRIVTPSGEHIITHSPLRDITWIFNSVGNNYPFDVSYTPDEYVPAFRKILRVDAGLHHEFGHMGDGVGDLYHQGGVATIPGYGKLRIAAYNNDTMGGNTDSMFYSPATYIDARRIRQLRAQMGPEGWRSIYSDGLSHVASPHERDTLENPYILFPTSSRLKLLGPRGENLNNLISNKGYLLNSLGQDGSVTEFTTKKDSAGMIVDHTLSSQVGDPRLFALNTWHIVHMVGEGENKFPFLFPRHALNLTAISDQMYADPEWVPEYDINFLKDPRSVGHIDMTHIYTVEIKGTNAKQKIAALDRTYAYMKVPGYEDVYYVWSTSEHVETPPLPTATTMPTTETPILPTRTPAFPTSAPVRPTQTSRPGTATRMPSTETPTRNPAITPTRQTEWNIYLPHVEVNDIEE